MAEVADADRPSFNTLYFSERRPRRHNFGPNSKEVLRAAQHVDAAIGLLVRGIDRLGLTSRTTFVVVSDHGMAQTSRQRVIYLDDYLTLDEIEVVDWSPNVGINPATSSSAESIYHQKLHGKHPALCGLQTRGLAEVAALRHERAFPPSSASPNWAGRSRRTRPLRSVGPMDENSKAARTVTIRVTASCTAYSSPPVQKFEKV